MIENILKLANLDFFDIPTSLLLINIEISNLPKVVARATVKKTDVIAYFEGSEQEVIVMPKEEGDLMDVRLVEGDS